MTIPLNSQSLFVLFCHAPQEWASSGGGALSLTAHAYPLGPPTYLPAPGYPNWSCSEKNYLNLSRVADVSFYLGEFTALVQQFGDPAQTRMVLEETASNSMARLSRSAEAALRACGDPVTPGASAPPCALISQ